ncbi:MAG: formyltetrahydrofolate deformylase [Elusimicrobia bacterium]|jgi:formyltetrahydrofolate deformylase|nr:formyltetrahydrofolate deformylase [Elusimicrobiota bacterium]
MNKKDNAILLISCPDRQGLIAAVSEFIHSNNGNIEDADQHVDRRSNVFFMRIEWELNNFNIDRNQIEKEFLPIAEKFNMKWTLSFSKDKIKTAIFVSKYLHCLYDILYKYREGQLHLDISLIISNHSDAADIAKQFGIKYVIIEKNKENKIKQEEKEMALLKKHDIDTVILARYMQILSKKFVDNYRFKIINIHHSFLPAFVGAKPYEQAFTRGVKIIGATGHYVTEELDRGPIIEQDVTRVSHRDSVEDLKRIGEELEKFVLSRAVRWHAGKKILVYKTSEGNKTVVFD